MPEGGETNMDPVKASCSYTGSQDSRQWQHGSCFHSFHSLQDVASDRQISIRRSYHVWNNHTFLTILHFGQILEMNQVPNITISYRDSIRI